MMSYDEKINLACRETSPRYPASLKTWGRRMTSSINVPSGLYIAKFIVNDITIQNIKFVKE
jgi:hypothetical protein